MCRLEVTETDKAVLALKSQRRRLLDQQKRAVAQIDRETEVARQLIASGHKDRARLALKKRHIQQQTVDKLDGLLLNVESMVCPSNFLFV